MRIETVAKVGKNIETYQWIGTYSWRDALAQSKGVGVLTTNPHPEMLTAEGHKKDISSAATKTYITVIYNEDYVLDFMHRRLAVGLGFIQGEKLDEEPYRKLFDKQILYSRTEKSREKDAEILEDAKNASAKYGQDIDYWLETYRTAASAKAEKVDNSTEKAANNSNNKSREKVAA